MYLWSPWTLCSSNRVCSLRNPRRSAATTSCLRRSRRHMTYWTHWQSTWALDFCESSRTLPSRSGLLPIIQSEIHVVVAATHTFDKSLMDTIIQKNVNPIGAWHREFNTRILFSISFLEKLERSSLIMSSVIHGVTPDQLLNSSQLERVTDQNPKLIENKWV